MEKRIKRQLRNLFVATSDYVKYYTGETYKAQAEAAGIDYEDFKNARKDPPRITPSRAWIDAMLNHYGYTEDQVMEGIAPVTKEKRDLKEEVQDLEALVRELRASVKELVRERAQLLDIIEKQSAALGGK